MLQINNGTSEALSDCTDKTGNYATITTLAILAGNIMSLPLGIILDKFGTFLCRILCTLLITIGNLKLQST